LKDRAHCSRAQHIDYQSLQRGTRLNHRCTIGRGAAMLSVDTY
jgi:hypothetical protein